MLKARARATEGRRNRMIWHFPRSVATSEAGTKQKTGEAGALSRLAYISRIEMLGSI